MRFEGLARQVALARPGRYAIEQADAFGGPTAPLETAAYLDSFLPSLMPRTNVHQGLAAGLNVLAARGIGTAFEAATRAVLPTTVGLTARLIARGAQISLGQGLASIPAVSDEAICRSGLRAGGEVLRSFAIGAAAHDLVRYAQHRSGRSHPVMAGVLASAGVGVWASRRMNARKSEIKRWPVPQDATVSGAAAIGVGVAAAGTMLGFAVGRSGDALRWYLGRDLGRPLIASAVNSALWGTAATITYNGAIAAIGRSNEKIEAAYGSAPTSPFVSGSDESESPFTELGMQGRRFVTDVVGADVIAEVMHEPAKADPIRIYVGFNTMPLYPTGRAELALAELDRTGAFDRSYLLLASPTGTGWVDHVVVEAAELLTRGDIATCAIQYGRFPSFLCVQKVSLGRSQFRLLLWGIRQRLAERPPERRPKILVFGESLGAWTASDVVMAQGIGGFDHYGIDKALWFGLPGLAKWSRNGMASGSSELVPAGTVKVFDHPDEITRLAPEERDRLRAVIVSHDNDPIAQLGPELAVREPNWLRDHNRGRNVPASMSWVPVSTFVQVAIDAANAMVTLPGEFRSFGHDYRADTARFALHGFGLPAVDEEQMTRVEAKLRLLDVERVQRIKVPSNAGYHPSGPGNSAMPAGRSSGARWLRAAAQPTSS